MIVRRLALSILATSLCASMAQAGAPSVSADEALARLTEGNRRYRSGKPRRRHRDPRRRNEVASAQHPIAAVLGCADSRVPPEIVFDQGLGDLFVVREAGNVADDHGLASLEYAVEHLGVRLIVVLGHERCGAVSAAVSGSTAHGHLETLLDALRPAVVHAKAQPGDPVDNGVRANVARVVEDLRASKPVLASKVHDGSLKVVGARYDLETGAAELLP
jgi:carbonic anhydrase